MENRYWVYNQVPLLSAHSFLSETLTPDNLANRTLSGDSALDNSEHLALRARCPRGSRNFIGPSKRTIQLIKHSFFSKTPPPGSNKQTKKKRQRRLL